MCYIKKKTEATTSLNFVVYSNFDLQVFPYAYSYKGYYTIDPPAFKSWSLWFKIQVKLKLNKISVFMCDVYSSLP